MKAKKYCYINDGMKDHFNYYQKIARHHDLVFVAFEDVYDEDRPYNRRIFLEVAYAAQEKKLTLEEAKEFALKLREEHAEFYLSRPEFAQSINRMRKDGKEPSTNPVNVQKFLSFRVSFWDKYIDRIQAPAIAEVRIYGTRVRYYVSDELQRLVLVCEEEFPAYNRDISLSSPDTELVTSSG
jgi:hypothetical protein